MIGPVWNHPACLPEEQFLKRVAFRTGRTGGPGGQHRNKVETHVWATDEPTGFAASAGERRSQHENKHMAVRRLRLILAIRLRTPVPKGRGLAVLDEPAGSALWRSRTRSGRILLNPDHWDYASMLAEALDVIADNRWEPSQAAIHLGTTASQLVRMIKDHPDALLELNRRRQELGLHALR